MRVRGWRAQKCARDARGARASQVVNHHRSRAGASRAAVLFSSSVLLSSCPSLRVRRSLAPPARRRGRAHHERARGRTPSATRRISGVGVCCQCAERRGACVCSRWHCGHRPPRPRTQTIDPPRGDRPRPSQRPSRRGRERTREPRRSSLSDRPPCAPAGTGGLCVVSCGFAASSKLQTRLGVSRFFSTRLILYGRLTRGLFSHSPGRSGRAARPVGGRCLCACDRTAK